MMFAQASGERARCQRVMRENNDTAWSTMTLFTEASKNYNYIHNEKQILIVLLEMHSSEDNLNCFSLRNP